jgi:hypothetical protein
MPHVITLVHGTFARNAAWCKLDSPLCQALSKALGPDVVFSPFAWSGRNSFQDRQIATEKLASHLANLRTSYPQYKHSAIAHSHGGNILVNALAGLPEGLDSAICLSTPFFIIQPKPEGRFMEQKLLAYVVITVCFSLIYLVYWVSNQLFSSLTTRILLGSTILIALIIGYFLVIRDSADLKISRIESVYERLLASSTKRSLVSYKMLLMRSPRDEATLSLGVFTFANWIIDQSRNIVLSLKLWFARYALKYKIVVGLTYIVFFYGTYYFRNSDIERYVFGSWGLIGAISIFCFLLSNALLSFGFGMDVFFGVWRTRISVETCPPGLWPTYVLSPHKRDASMRHSQPYHSPEAIKVIVSWLSHDHINTLPEYLQALFNEPTTTDPYWTSV